MVWRRRPMSVLGRPVVVEVQCNKKDVKDGAISDRSYARRTHRGRLVVVVKGNKQIFLAHLLRKLLVGCEG